MRQWAKQAELEAGNRIELMLATHRKRAVRQPTLAIYLLWHRLMEPQSHRPAPDKVLTAALAELQEPSMFAFTARVPLGRTLTSCSRPHCASSLVINP